MSFAINASRPAQSVQFGVTFNTHCEDNISNNRLRYTAQINQAKNTAQKDGSIASIDDTKDPFRVSFRVGQNYAAADIQTRYNGTQCVLTEKNESAKQFCDRIVNLLKIWAPTLKSGEEHTAEIPDLATQLLSDFVKAAQVGKVESKPIQHQDSHYFDSHEYTVLDDKQFYNVIVHREKGIGKLAISFNKEHHGRLHYDSYQGDVTRFECELRGKPTLRLPSGRQFEASEENPSTQHKEAAIAKLQQNLISLVSALEGKKPLQEALK